MSRTALQDVENPLLILCDPRTRGNHIQHGKVTPTHNLRPFLAIYASGAPSQAAKAPGDGQGRIELMSDDSDP